MSNSGWGLWSDCIKGTGCVAGGVYSLKDGAAWTEFGKEGSHSFDGAEVLNILKCIKSGPTAAEIHVHGVKQAVLRAGDDICLAKKGSESCVVAIKCNQCMLVGIGGPNSEPRALLLPLSSTADSLKSSGY